MKIRPMATNYIVKYLDYVAKVGKSTFVPVCSKSTVFETASDY